MPLSRASPCDACDARCCRALPHREQDGEPVLGRIREILRELPVG